MNKLLKPMMIDIKNIEFNNIKAQFVLSHPQIVDNVAMIPVFSKQTVDNSPRFMDEAMMNKELIIREIGNWDGVKLENQSDDYVVVPSGSHFVGGKQNRGIDRISVLEPMENKNVDVHCFQQGRSHGDSTFDGLSETPVDVILKTMTTKGTGGSWDEISKYTSHTGQEEGGALSAFMEKTEEDRSKIVLNFETCNNQTGVISVFGNEYIMFESFPNHEVFNKYRSSIYRGKMASYVWKNMKNRENKQLIYPSTVHARVDALFKEMKVIFEYATNQVKSDDYTVFHGTRKNGVSDMIVNNQNQLVYMFTILRL